MVQVLARIKVADFAQFIGVFSTRGLAKRKLAGSYGSEVFRSGEDEVVILFTWSSRDAIEGFFNSPEIKALMQSAGIQGQPEMTFVERVGEFAA